MDNPNHSVQSSTFPWRNYLLICIIASVLVLAIGWLSINAQDSSPDATRNRTIAFNVAKYGVYSLSTADLPNPEPTLQREPLYPYYMALVLRLFSDPAQLSVACFNEAPECAAERLLLHRANLALYLALVWAFAAAAFLMIRQRWVVIVLMLMLFSVDHFQYSINLTELPAALLLIIHAMFLYRIAAEARPSKYSYAYALISGIALGMLMLVKVIFQYWLILLAVGILAWGLWQRRKGLARLGPYTAVACVALLIILPWLLRNYVTFNSFRIAGGDAAVLALRTEFLSMTATEYAAGFAFFAPRSLRHALLQNFDESDYQRFIRETADSRNVDSFYFRGSTGTGLVGERAQALYGNVDASSMYSAALSLIRERWPQHLATTLLFAWRGAFIDGYVGAYQGHLAVTAPIINAIYRLYWRTLGLVMALSVPSMLGAAAYALWKRHWPLLLFLMPALYSYGIHAVATHYIPRYSAPLVPIFLIAIGLLLCLIAQHLHPRATESGA